MEAETDHAITPPVGRRIQQRDIAQIAGVSISTVSRVLNNAEGISKDVQQRVLEAAASLGYQIKDRNRLEQIHLFVARLATHRTIDAFHTDILNGVEAACRRHAIHLSYTVIDSFATDTTSILQKVKQNNTDGFIFVALDDAQLITQALEHNFRIALINAELPGLPVDTFLPDNFTAPRLAVHYLIERGHRDILHVTHIKRSTIRERYRAYRTALEEAGIPFNPRLLLDTTVPLEPENCYEMMREFLRNDPPHFTAIFCANDNAAIGIARAVQEAGLRIPQDISIIGMDDVPMAAFMLPPLTTIRIEREELGLLAVQRLLERSFNPALTPTRVEIFSQLVERQSVTSIKSPDDRE